ncbi:MAG: hypothetical protein LUE29_12740 [Lachnospiraceae bacterium]|nr:hypothetical protein [Lachnospiraceae bacterium]
MKKLTVDGITFDTTKEAKAAERELDAIKKIRGRMDVTDPVYAKVLYEKLIEKEMLHTKVGDKFLAELQGYFETQTAAESADAAAGADNGIAADSMQAENVPDETAPMEAGGAEDTIPYLDEVLRKEADRDAAVGTEELQEEFATNPVGAEAVSSDTARLEGILHRAILDGENRNLSGGNEEASGTDGTVTGESDYRTEEDSLTERDFQPETASRTEEDDLPEEYFGATGLDALVEEYSEAEAAKAGEAKNEDAPAQPEKIGKTDENGETDMNDETDLEAFMKEYGLDDIIDTDIVTAEADLPDVTVAAEADLPEETMAAETELSDEAVDAAELDALMREYGAAEAEKPETADIQEKLPEEEETASADAEQDASVYEDAAAGAGAASRKTVPEQSLNLNLEEENSGRQEAGEFHLELDDVDLYDDEPDDDTLLAQARTLKKELHQEDLSEVFSEHEEQPAKKRFSLYGVLIFSVILNVALIAAMAITVQVFRNSDNRNILNYERILEQEYQSDLIATPSDADAVDVDEN